MVIVVTQPCLCNSMDCSHTRLLSPWSPPGTNTGVGGHSLLQGIFLTQGSNPGLPPCRQILYHLSHQKSWWVIKLKQKLNPSTSPINVSATIPMLPLEAARAARLWLPQSLGQASVLWENEFPSNQSWMQLLFYRDVVS